MTGKASATTRREVPWDGGAIAYELERKRVKNINLRVRPDGSVYVSASPRVTLRTIDAFVRQKGEFIRRAQAQYARQAQGAAGLPDVPRAACRALFTQAVEELLPLLAPYGVAMPQIKLRDMKSRWGSCAWQKGQITLNTRLYYAPRECLDYVALHELCHFVRHDHSPAFHALLTALMPDWRARKKRLEAGGAGLSIPPQVRQILERLNAAGHEAYLVGGCVRDLLRGEAPKDWDICTSALPRETEACFAGERVVETGLRHGTVTVLADGQPYEITTFRADGPYSDGRRPDRVDFVSDLTEDLARRDFTINAMALGLDGQVRDPFGGREDLGRKRIRCVGEPDKRFREDGLRVMRGLRFSATLDFEIDGETGAAIRRNLSMLDHVAAERINTELCKLLMAKDCGIGVLREFPEVFCRFWPQLKPLVELAQANPWHCYGGWEHTLHALAAAPADLVVRLAVLLHDIGKPVVASTDANGIDHFYGHAQAGAELADGMLRGLKFDNATRERVVTLVRWHDAPVQATGRSVRRWLGRLGEEGLFQLLEVQRCDAMGQDPDLVKERLEENGALRVLAREIIEEGQCFSLRDLAVDGRDLLALGVPAGPEVGRVLGALLEAVMDQEVPNERGALLERARELAGA